MSVSTRILLALVMGGLLGAVFNAAMPESMPDLLAISEPVGALWLSSLRMTILPLIVCLIITGVGATAETARAGGLMARILGLFLFFLCVSALVAVILVPIVLTIWPIDPVAGEALKASVPVGQVVGVPPGVADWLKAMVPTNIFAAAAEGSILQLVFFALVFGFAVTRLGEGHRQTILTFFEAVGEAMMLIVKAIIWLGPIGVFALAFGVGGHASAGMASLLVYYMAIVIGVCSLVGLLMYPVAVMMGGVSLGAFARAVIPAQSVAASTQSSLATLPTMIESARDRLGLPAATSGIVLPLAVALFRLSSPAANIAVALFVAALYGVELTPMNLLGASAVGVIVAVASVSAPSQINFFITIPPICMVLGAPFEVLAILIAIESLPDMFRTISNVTADLAMSAVVARQEKRRAGEQESAGN